MQQAPYSSVCTATRSCTEC